MVVRKSSEPMEVLLSLDDDGLVPMDFVESPFDVADGGARIDNR